MPMCCCAIGCQYSTIWFLFGCVSWYDVITCEK